MPSIMTPHLAVSTPSFLNKQPVGVTKEANAIPESVWLYPWVYFQKHEMWSADSYPEGPNCVFHIAQKDLAQGKSASIIVLAF